MTEFINSFKGLENERLSFIRDNYGTVHLVNNIVSRAWLKKHHPDFIQVQSYISKMLQPHIPIIMCTELNLTGNEINDLTLEDF
ncbi:hypothetical protein [Metabacillus sp. FJAT-53654]|uniref:Uncharacterized protein n=1 Tax=Metabacillus rhizosphaerae TaxID=3117747 RepID=A0ABZ2MPR5_9BACI